MTQEPQDNSTGRRRHKYTPEIDARLREILEEEQRKTRRMGAGYKQKLTNKQIHEMLVEEGCLLPYKPPLELAAISENTVDRYSMVHVDCARYSVPEHLVGYKVTVKKYHDELRIYAANEHICIHKRIFGNGHMQVDIYHYLNTLYKKPGAVRNSVALKSIPCLKAIFDTHFAKQPKRFIELMLQNKALSIDELIHMFEQKTKRKAEIIALDVVKPLSNVDVAARANVSSYSVLVNGGVG